MEKKTKNSSFVNSNGHIIPKPFGTDYELEAGKVYTLTHDRDLYMDYLIEDKDFEFPTTYYLNDKDNKFIKSCNELFCYLVGYMNLRSRNEFAKSARRY